MQAGVGAIMVSYSSWNGVKMSGNRYLLTDVLKGELGFKGFLVSDWAAIEYLGPAYDWDREVIRGSVQQGAFTVFYLHRGRLAGALTVGRSEDLLPARRINDDRVHGRARQVSAD